MLLKMEREEKIVRKLLRQLLVAVLLLGGVSFIYEDSNVVQASSDAPYIKFGDINFDGIINGKDSELLQQHIAAAKSDEVHAKHPDWYLKGKTFKAADVNADNKVDITDLLHIQRHIAMEKGEAYVSHIITVTLMDENKTKVYDCFPVIYNWKDDARNCYPKLYQPSKSGYIFKGWYLHLYRAESYGSLANIYDHVLCADWEEEKTFASYKLNFDANGGTCTIGYYTLKSGDSYGILPIPTRKGYTFTGWYTEKSGGSKVSSSTKMKEKNVTVYAQWKSDRGGYDNAATLPINGSWSDSYWHTDSDHEHWYKIVLPADGKLTFKAMSYASVLYKLYTQDLKQVGGMHWSLSNGTENSPNTVESNYVLSKGTYYFQVSPNGNKGRYKLNALFQKYTTNDENAISYDSPQNLSAESTVNGALTETDLEDWYRIYISGSRKYKIRLTSYFSSCYIKLYNSDLSKTLLSNSVGGSETSPQTKVCDIDVPDGVYYLKIDRSIYSAAGKYILTFNDIISVNNITMNKSSLTLGMYCGARLTAYVWPSDAVNQAVLWKSSNPLVATVSDGGFVSAKSAGTATITATAADGSGVKANCIVKVQEDPEITCQRNGHIGVWVTSKQATVLEKGNQYRICTRCHRKEYADIAKLTPTVKVTASQITLKVNQSTSKVKISSLAQGDYVTSWKSSNLGIVKVTNSGKIIAQKKTGTATVTVALASGKNVQIKVKVQKTAVNPSKIMGIGTALEMKRGTSRTLKPVISPITCTQKITYKTSNKKVATVSSTGKITAKRRKCCNYRNLWK